MSWCRMADSDVRGLSVIRRGGVRLALTSSAIAMGVVLFGCAADEMDEKDAISVAAAHVRSTFHVEELREDLIFPRDLGSVWKVEFGFRSYEPHGGSITVLLAKPDGEVMFAFGNSLRPPADHRSKHQAPRS